MNKVLIIVFLEIWFHNENFMKFTNIFIKTIISLSL